MTESTAVTRRDQLYLAICLCLVTAHWMVSKLMNALTSWLPEFPLVRGMSKLYYSEGVSLILILLIYGWPIVLATRVRVLWLRWTVIVLSSLALIWSVAQHIYDWYTEPLPFIYFQF